MTIRELIEELERQDALGSEVGVEYIGHFCPIKEVRFIARDYYSSPDKYVLVLG